MSNQKFPSRSHFQGLGNIEGFSMPTVDLYDLMFGRVIRVTLLTGATTTFIWDFDFLPHVDVFVSGTGVYNKGVNGTNYTLECTGDFRTWTLTNASAGTLTYEIRVKA